MRRVLLAAALLFLLPCLCLAQTTYSPATGGSGGGTWGTITGTLGDQTDLDTALDGKLADCGADGVAVRTASGVTACRSITSPAGTLAITNADGVAGNIGLDVDTSIFGQFSSGVATVSGNCTLGDTYLETDANLWSMCTSTNTWRTAISLSDTVAIGNGGTGLTTAADDTVLNSNGSAWSAKAVPDCDDAGGSHLNYDTATNTFSCGTTSSGSGGGLGSGRATKAEIFTDLLGQPSGTTAATIATMDESSGFRFYTTVTSGITSSSAAADGNHPGVLSLSSETSSIGLSSILTRYITLGSGALTAEVLIKTGANLSDGTDGYVISFGILDASTLDPADGCGIQYEDSNNSGNWEYFCDNDATPTVADSSVAVAANTWYKLKIVVNAAATSVNFTINGAASADITTNIPPDADLTLQTFFLKTSGTTARNVFVDYVYMSKDVSR